MRSRENAGPLGAANQPGDLGDPMWATRSFSTGGAIGRRSAVLEPRDDVAPHIGHGEPLVGPATGSEGLLLTRGAARGVRLKGAVRSDEAVVETSVRRRIADAATKARQGDQQIGPQHRR